MWATSILFEVCEVEKRAFGWIIIDECLFVVIFQWLIIAIVTMISTMTLSKHLQDNSFLASSNKNKYIEGLAFNQFNYLLEQIHLPAGTRSGKPVGWCWLFSDRLLHSSPMFKTESVEFLRGSSCSSRTASSAAIAAKCHMHSFALASIAAWESKEMAYSVI